MRVLLYKAVGHFTDPIVKTVGGIQRTLIANAKVLGKGGGQRQLCPAETVNRLPIIADRKQAGLLVLLTQRRQQLRTLR
ncbi:hypothetical protein D3C75_1086990 [compost metagenome]